MIPDHGSQTSVLKASVKGTIRQRNYLMRVLSRSDNGRQRGSTSQPRLRGLWTRREAAGGNGRRRGACGVPWAMGGNDRQRDLRLQSRQATGDNGGLRLRGGRNVRQRGVTGSHGKQRETTGGYYGRRREVTGGNGGQRGRQLEQRGTTSATEATGHGSQRETNG